MATLDAQLCSPEERALSARPGALLHCLPRDESIALAVCVVASCQTLAVVNHTFGEQFVTLSATLSLCACVVTFALILVSAFMPHEVGVCSH